MSKQNKKSIKDRLKNFVTFVKRATKPKEPPKEKVVKPKTYTFRKLGAISFWVLFGFMFLFVFINMFFSSSSAKEKETEDNDKEVNVTTQPEAIQFAKDFSNAYFTWDIEDMDKRSEQLDKYLATGIENTAGLNVTGINWNSVYNSSTLKRVNEITDNKSEIVLKVNVGLIKPSEKKKDDDEEKSLSKYFVIPIAYDGENLGVYSEPYFSNVKDEEKTEIDNNHLLKGLKKPDDSKEEGNIENFLNTFFTSYAEDSPDKLSYVVEDPDVVGLDNTMDFIEVKKTEVFQADSADKYIVYTEASFAEPETGEDDPLIFESSYYMLIKKQNDRYIVEKMNAEDYIEKLTGNSVFKDVDVEALEEQTTESDENDSSEEDEE